MRVVARAWLSPEATVICIAALLGRWSLGTGCWAGLVALIAPDLPMLAYLRSNRAGRIVCNVAHSYVIPASFIVLAVALGAAPPLVGLLLAWVAYIGLDRALGFGFKGATFGEAHLGPIGRRERR